MSVAFEHTFFLITTQIFLLSCTYKINVDI